ncbi:MAG: lipoate--protein ligase family protein [Candidatus Omnitrophica bacterium]|nr:lipoate--protein ligase family protein [Candidatus Omnitrophota bacterium]
MEILDKSFDTVKENLIFDELLLSEAENGKRAKTLRVWEPEDYAVVIGKGCSEEEDVYTERCLKENVPVLKRASGGGTVLIGKGCLGYSLVLPYEANTNFTNIKQSYKYILGKIAGAFSEKGINLTYEPVSDLALDNKKVSGNSQARKRKFFLHHGTFLYALDLDKVSYYLKEPKKIPPYRKFRKHKDFLANLKLPASEIRSLIKSAFLEKIS